MKKFVPFLSLVCSFVLFLFSSGSAFAQTDDDIVTEIPELVFVNPKLVSGADRTEGATYLFANVAPGIDASLLLKKFSRPDIYVKSVDLSGLGWEKAFQPQFGLPGTVAAHQDWYIDFEVTFLKAGTTTKESVDRFTLTSLDVDGDGQSLKEYVIMEKASSVTYAEVSYLNKTTPATVVLPTCPKCKKQSMPLTCKKCDGTGIEKSGKGKGSKKKCKDCNGVGKVYEACDHPWDGQDAVAEGPKDNFANIDTSATAVMATYVYNNKDIINFRIGANSGDYGTYGDAGLRLNSLWFKGFNLNPTEYKILPVSLHSLRATKEARHVAVSWLVESDETLSHFVVERSMDGKTFKDLGTVFAAGNGQGNYAFNDMMPTSSTATISYRIRMVDAAQQVSYSTVALVRMSREAESAVITTYPNPAQDKLNVAMPGAWQGQAVQVAVYNNAGVQVEAAQYPQAGAREILQISRLPKGVYIVKASTKTAPHNKPFIKTKLFQNPMFVDQ